MRQAPASLALEDGTVFRGVAWGAEGTVTGEACFNTGMTGYQEVLTDPSYHGQIVTMTAPQIGNTGVNDADEQSWRPWVAGFVVRDVSQVTSSWRSEGSLDAYLKKNGIPGITEVDTRRLTRHLRDRGAMRAALSTETLGSDELVDIARSSPEMVGRDLATEVSTDEPYEWDLDRSHERARSGYASGWEEGKSGIEGRRYRMAALDFGIKRNILDLLVAGGFDVTVLPATTPAKEIASGGYDCAFLSNGPGDPEPVTYGIETVRSLVGDIPVFGICLGHQILGLALGAETFKLPFGHRGSNHPVEDLDTGRIEITCQNHGFAVAPGSIEETAARLSHHNLNDGTVEGLVVPGVAMSVQYHPESGPGPHDSRYLFQRARELVETFEPKQVKLPDGTGAYA
jgi:carbamoyl-phosphate synthase small subunit